MKTKIKNRHSIRKKIKTIIISVIFLSFLLLSGTSRAADESTIENLIPNEFQGGGVAQGWNGDDDEWNYTLPFTFNFYGVDYTDIKISSNGYICLDDSKDCTDYYPSLDNDYLGPIIFPMGTDLRTDENPTSDIYIAENSDNVVIRWDAVEWGETNQINFEAVLYSNGNIKFNYGEQIVSLLTGAAVGISKGDGSTYTESVYNGGVDFDMVDTSAWGVFGPNLISLSPHNGSIGIKPSPDLIIAFDRNVYAGSGEITVRKYEDDSVVEAIDVASGNVGGLGGDVVAVNSEADLINGVKYYILISSGAFKDGSDADYSGIGDKSTWSFTIMPDGNDFAFTDDFYTASHKDAGETTANWNISEGTIRLPSFGNNWTNADEINSDRDIISTKADYSRGESAPVIAHDSDGNPMIAWTEWIQAESRSEIYFTRWNGSEWVNMDGITAGSEDVSDRGNHNYYPRMEIDSNDYPHIIWHDIVDDEIYYTRWDGSDWVDAGGNPGNEKISGTTLTYYVYTHVADLKLDSDGRPNILWRANSVNGEDFYFTRWNGSQWVQMDGTTPGYGLATTNGEVALWALPFSFLLDEDDRPHISWVNNYVYYTGWNGSAWTYADDATLGAETVSSSLKTGDFMRLDSGQNPVIMYSDNNYVYFTKYVPGNGWVQSDGETSGEEAVAADGEYPNFYLDSEDNVYATWINFNNEDQIYFSKSVGGSWQKMDGDPGFDKISSDRASTGAIWYQNLKILSDSNGYPNVAWLQDEGNFQQPMFVRWNGSAWTAGDGSTPGSEAIWLSSYDMYDIDFTIGPDDTLMFIWWRDSFSTYYVYY
ncbi:MAG: Ig-like domain-containing protein, partial [Bacteroidales bacterium]|nr:Ig-like domain-containing protein [Bacteroidales bacterium]